MVRKQGNSCRRDRESLRIGYPRIFLTALLMALACVSALTAQELDPKAGANPLDPATFRAVAALFRYDQSIPFDARVLDRIETDS